MAKGTAWPSSCSMPWTQETPLKEQCTDMLRSHVSKSVCRRRPPCVLGCRRLLQLVVVVLHPSKPSKLYSCAPPSQSGARSAVMCALACRCDMRNVHNHRCKCTGVSTVLSSWLAQCPNDSCRLAQYAAANHRTWMAKAAAVNQQQLCHPCVMVCCCILCQLVNIARINRFIWCLNLGWPDLSSCARCMYCCPADAAA